MSSALPAEKPIQSSKSSWLVLLLITLFSLGAGLWAASMAPDGANLSQKVPPWIAGFMTTSILLFVGHMGYQILRVLRQPDES